MPSLCLPLRLSSSSPSGDRRSFLLLLCCYPWWTVAVHSGFGEGASNKLGSATALALGGFSSFSLRRRGGGRGDDVGAGSSVVSCSFGSHGCFTAGLVLVFGLQVATASSFLRLLRLEAASFGSARLWGASPPVLLIVNVLRRSRWASGERHKAGLRGISSEFGVSSCSASVTAGVEASGGQRWCRNILAVSAFFWFLGVAGCVECVSTCNVLVLALLSY